MARYIDADALIQELKRQYMFLFGTEEIPNGIGMLIENFPTADVIKAIRCKDCKHRIINENYGKRGYMRVKAVCDLDSADPFELSRNAEDDEWFCADAERRDDDKSDIKNYQ